MEYKNQINEAGDFNLEVCEIISYHREVETGDLFHQDIRNILLSFEIKEDIFSHYITGRVTVQDTQDVRTMLPITGLERLNVKFNTPGCPGYNAVEEEGHPFQIYKIESVARDGASGRSQAYDIYFCSQELYYNGIHRVSKAYSGQIELAVDDIFHSPTFLNSKKRLNYEPTASSDKVVVPNMKPLQAIKWLSSRAKSQKYKNAGYVFYETSEGYFFRSIESMLAVNGVSARPVKFAYTYQINNIRDAKTGNRDVNQDMRSAITYEFKKPVSLLDNLTDGMVANRMIRHDAFNKTITTTDYNYFDEFGKYFHTEHDNTDKAQLKGVLPFVRFEDTNTDLSSKPMAKLMTVTNSSKIHNDYEHPSKSETLQVMVSQRAKYMNQRLVLNVHGNTLLHAGDMIQFDMPTIRPLLDKSGEEPSPYWHGRYLILSIRHVVENSKGGKHSMVLECVKDAIRTPYPISQENMTINKPDSEVNDIYSLDKQILNQSRVD